MRAIPLTPDNHVRGGMSSVTGGGVTPLSDLLL
jgi:hypothetical protein